MNFIWWILFIPFFWVKNNLKIIWRLYCITLYYIDYIVLYYDWIRLDINYNIEKKKAIPFKKFFGWWKYRKKLHWKNNIMMAICILQNHSNSDVSIFHIFKFQKNIQVFFFLWLIHYNEDFILNLLLISFC